VHAIHPKVSSSRKQAINAYVMQPPVTSTQQTLMEYRHVKHAKQFIQVALHATIMVNVWGVMVILSFKIVESVVVESTDVPHVLRVTLAISARMG